MVSLSEEVEELRERTVREQTDLYRQLREHLIREVERHRSLGNERLANVIAESVKE
ncbi:MAG TPA: hypothetical protein VNI77_03105 [Nitrososphaera sp.]|nr:hypothetical protein [Nitrososphaera sp.]